jgi:glyoxylase-like metal-dependent hydrolase (beta-lactamase superfamily II)
MIYVPINLDPGRGLNNSSPITAIHMDWHTLHHLIVSLENTGFFFGDNTCIGGRVVEDRVELKLQMDRQYREER